MRGRFNRYVGVDYSGAATPQSRSPSIQVYQSQGDNPPEIVRSPTSTKSRNRNWNRAELAEWLLQTLASEEACVVGIDHGFSFPISYFERYNLTSWDHFLEDFTEYWPTDGDGATVEQFRDGAVRRGESSEFRLAERWTSSAKSVFQFDVNGSVAKSTHAGIPFLLQLRRAVRERVHFWPFDGWTIPDGKSVVTETYPSLFRNRYAREDRTGDQQDAFAVSKWLCEMDIAGSLELYFSPPLNPTQRKQAGLEGWILGVL